MRTMAIIISMVVAVAIAATTSVWFGILIALCCVVYQVILSYGRTATFKTIRRAMFWGVPGSSHYRIDKRFLVYSRGTVVVFGVNLMMS